MRRLLVASLTGALAVGCAGQDVTGPPDNPAPLPGVQVLTGVSVPANVVASWRDAVDDAIARLIPALGPAGAALGTPFRALRDATRGTLDVQLVAAVGRQFDAIAVNLPPALAPDADALRITLDALGALTGK